MLYVYRVCSCTSLDVKKFYIFLCDVCVRHIVEYFLPTPRFDSKVLFAKVLKIEGLDRYHFLRSQFVNIE